MRILATTSAEKSPDSTLSVPSTSSSLTLISAVNNIPMPFSSRSGYAQSNGAQSIFGDNLLPNANEELLTLSSEELERISFTDLEELLFDDAFVFDRPTPGGRNAHRVPPSLPHSVASGLTSTKTNPAKRKFVSPGKAREYRQNRAIRLGCIDSHGNVDMPALYRMERLLAAKSKNISTTAEPLVQKHRGCRQGKTHSARGIAAQQGVQASRKHGAQSPKVVGTVDRRRTPIMQRILQTCKAISHCRVRR